MKKRFVQRLLVCLLACCLLLPMGFGALTEEDSQARMEQIFGILEGRHQNPSTLEEYLRLATMAYARGAYDQALAHLDQCIALVGEDAASLGMLWTEKGAVYRKMENLEEAARALETAAGYTPNHPGMLLAQGQVLSALKRYGEAVAALERYTALIPESAGGWRLLSAAYGDDGKKGKAGEAAGQAASLEGDPLSPLLAEARTQALLGNLAAAESGYTSYLEQSAGDPGGNAHFLRGTVRMQQGNAEGAIADIGTALTLSHPEPAVCYEYLSSCYYLLGNYEQVLETGELAVSLGGEVPAWDSLYLRMGISALALGRAEASVQYLDHALAQNDALAGVLYYRALAYMSQADYAKAIDDLTASIERGELAQQCLYNRALCRIQLEDLPAAIGDLEQALSLPGDEATAQAAEDMLWQIAMQYMAETED